MAAGSEFISHLQELLEDFGMVTFRKMFGGHGVFRDGLMFALIADDVLYFKVDDDVRGDFEARGLGPFTYKRGSKSASMSYYQAPEEVFDDREEMLAWAARAFDAALRADAKKRKKGK